MALISIQDVESPLPWLCVRLWERVRGGVSARQYSACAKMMATDGGWHPRFSGVQTGYFAQPVDIIRVVARSEAVASTLTHRAGSSDRAVCMMIPGGRSSFPGRLGLAGVLFKE